MERPSSNTSTNTPAIASSNAILFNYAERIGTGVRLLYGCSPNVATDCWDQIHGTVGGISALVTLLLLFHLFMVAAVRRGEAGKVNGEKVRVLTRLGLTALIVP